MFHVSSGAVMTSRDSCMDTDPQQWWCHILILMVPATCVSNNLGELGRCGKKGSDRKTLYPEVFAVCI